jgi:hypothetical protein
MMSVLILLLLQSLLAGWLWAEEPNASIHIEVLTLDGNSLDDASVELSMESVSRIVLSFDAKEGCYRSDEIPYGIYKLLIRRAGFRFHDQSLPVFQGHVSIRVFLRLSRSTDEEPTQVIGMVIPAPPSGTKLWVKMLPLLTTEYIGETIVRPDGKFLLSGLDAGEYVIVLMNGTNAVYIKQVSLYANLELIIPMQFTNLEK